MRVTTQYPSNVTEILTDSFRLYRDTFSKLVVYALLIVATTHGFTEVIARLIPDDISALDNDQILALYHDKFAAVSFCIFIQTVLGCTLYSAIIYRIDNVANSHDDSFFEVLASALKKIPTIMLSAFLYFLAVTLGMVLLIIPGLILLISLSFCGFFIILEDKGGVESLVESHRLVWGYWWRTNLVLALPSLIFIPYAFLVFQPSVNPLLIDIVNDAFTIFIGPYFYVLCYLQYKDLKLRKKLYS